MTHLQTSTALQTAAATRALSDGNTPLHLQRSAIHTTASTNPGSLTHRRFPQQLQSHSVQFYDTGDGNADDYDLGPASRLPSEEPQDLFARRPEVADEHDSWDPRLFLDGVANYMHLSDNDRAELHAFAQVSLC